MDVEVTKEKLAVLAMDPAQVCVEVCKRCVRPQAKHTHTCTHTIMHTIMPPQEVVLLRARVKELENQVAALKADQPAGDSEMIL